MRFSRLFVTTLREAPAGTETISAQLLTRAGFQRQLGAGIYSLLPFGERTANRIEQILREEMEAIDCYEVSMPVAQPAELWKETGRWDKVGPELVRFTDRSDRDMMLALTHEEVATDLVRRSVRSYRQLPVSFFQFQTKFRDEPRARAGLLRCREFVMKDAYSFDTDAESFNHTYFEFYKAYLRIFARLGLPVVVVEASGGYMGSANSHEFQLPAEAGEDLLLISPNGNYAVNSEVATVNFDFPDEDPQPLEEVETPNCTTIEQVANHLGVPKEKTLKAVFYDVDGKLIFVVIRGDLEINAAKLGGLLGVDILTPADRDLIQASGAVPGYASPVGLKDVYVVADESARAPNLVAGANREGYHLLNVNLGRDYEPDLVADIVQVREGMPSPVDGAPLTESRGIEVGNIFPLQNEYSGPLGATYLDANDEEHEIVMGSYGIGIGRNLAAIAEHYHDDAGLIWPASVAPFDVHLVQIGTDDESVNVAEQIYASLMEHGLDVLFDDRDTSPGVKFADADLIGVPLRVTISRRSLQSGGAELKRRTDDRDGARIVPIDNLVAELQTELDNALGELMRAADEAAKKTPAH